MDTLKFCLYLNDNILNNNTCNDNLNDVFAKV